MICPKCRGVGRIPFGEEPEIFSEEEWLRQATTEQLAEKLTDFSFWLVVELPTNERREKVRNKLLEWLKQPHKPNS